MKNFQILDKKVDTHGVHLIVKNKNNNCLHLEGHNLSKKDMGNKAVLRETPLYMFPVDQNFVNKEIKK